MQKQVHTCLLSPTYLANYKTRTMKQRLRYALLMLCGLLLIGGTAKAQTYFPNQATGKHTNDEHGSKWVFGGALSFWTDHKAKSTSLALSPEIAYLFNENIGLGIVGSYQYAKRGNDPSHESLWSLRPFARYYYLHREPFNLYVDGGFGISASKGMKGWEVGLRPGACVDLTKGLCLCLRLGFIGYRDRFVGGEEEGLGTTGWGIRFAPEELQIGLELEL